MDLPSLPSQFVYARLAWALVLAALWVGLWPSKRPLPRPALLGVACACLALVALPGASSLAWHLGLAFQYPSGLLVGLCLVRLHARWRGASAPTAAPSALPLPLAALLAATGALLYADALGLIAGGYYYAGFGPGAALCALLLALGCAAAIVRGLAAPQACAILGAVLLFSLARLPSGNLWDVLLDPLLWGWSLVSLCAASLRALRRRALDQPAALEPELPALGAAGAEPFSSIKE